MTLYMTCVQDQIVFNYRPPYVLVGAWGSVVVKDGPGIDSRGSFRQNHVP